MVQWGLRALKEFLEIPDQKVRSELVSRVSKGSKARPDLKELLGILVRPVIQVLPAQWDSKEKLALMESPDQWVLKVKMELMVFREQQEKQALRVLMDILALKAQQELQDLMALPVLKALKETKAHEAQPVQELIFLDQTL